MTKARRKKGKASDVADLGGRIKAVIESAIAGLEKRVETLRRGRMTADKTQELIAIAKDAAPLLGQVRRYDESMRHASRDLTPAIVIAYLRSCSAEQRLAIVSELDLDGDEREEGSVLS